MIVHLSAHRQCKAPVYPTFNHLVLLNFRILAHLIGTVVISFALLLLLLKLTLFSHVCRPSAICVSSFVNDLSVSFDNFSIMKFLLFILICKSLSCSLHIHGFFLPLKCTLKLITTKQWNLIDLWGASESFLPTSDLSESNKLIAISWLIQQSSPSEG